MGIQEQIKEIEAEMARTQKNKATEHHLGRLKGKLARLRAKLLEPSGKSGGAGEGFDVGKHGAARVALVGFPSVGKSEITETKSEAAGYEFTTLTAIPGNLMHNGVTIQILDLPGIIEGAAYGKGRGRQVISAAKTSDLILLMLDASKGDIQKELLLHELELVGIRCNQPKPPISFTKKPKGGINFTSVGKVQQSVLNAKICTDILKDMKIHNADIVCYDDCTIEQFIDCVNAKHRKYIPMLVCYNKIDKLVLEEVQRIAALPHHVVISCEMKLNYDVLIDRIWESLDLIRIYTKRKGEPPNLDEAIVLNRDRATVLWVCRTIHKDFEHGFRYAWVWGRGAKHSPQKVGISHELSDEDVVELVRN